MITLIGKTKDGTEVYWGKKESDDWGSRDLTLWVTLGVPEYSGDNYHRVPPKLEKEYFEDWRNWGEKVKAAIEAATDSEIENW